LAKERLSMRKIKEVLRLKSLGLSNNQIAGGVNVGKTTVYEYLKRAEAAGLSWPLPGNLDNAALEKLLFPVNSQPKDKSALPDFSYIHAELKKKGVTLTLLWEEYLANNPDGYRYTQFCHHYHAWRGHITPSMRQIHKAGEKMFVDFAGATIPIVNPATGEISQAQIFVAVLGASNYTYAQAVLSQDLENWIDFG
jgi:transposase